MMNRDEIIGIICDLYEELEISELGFDLKNICDKLEINLIPYSSFKRLDLLYKFDEDGFNLYNTNNGKFEIYFNDEISPKQRVKFTIPHEIGHIVLGHTQKTGNETQVENKEANIFANEFYCPQALMIHFKFKTPFNLISNFGISKSYSGVLLDKLCRRRRQLSSNEIRLIDIFEKNKLKL